MADLAHRWLARGETRDPSRPACDHHGSAGGFRRGRRGIAHRPPEHRKNSTTSARARGSAGRAARRASAGVVAAGSSGRPAPLVAAAAERSGRPPNARPLRAAHNMPFGGSRAAGTRVPAGADRICAASTVLLERAAAIASLPGVSAACAVELRGRRERRSGLHQLHVLLCVVARQHVAAADLRRRARRRVDRHARRGDAHGDQVHGERRLRATR